MLIAHCQTCVSKTTYPAEWGLLGMSAEGSLTEGEARFRHLLSPLDLGIFALKNRVIMGSMHTGLEEVSDGLSRQAVFLAERVRGGVGMGLHIAVNGEDRLLDVDTLIVCAGQLPSRSLHDELARRGIAAELVGGAFEAMELDAKRAIDHATRRAAVI